MTLRIWIILWSWVGLFAVAQGEPNQTEDVKTDLNKVQISWLEANPDLKIGFTKIPPQVFKDDTSGALSGLCIDYVHALEIQIGYQFRKVYFDTWNEMMIALSKGEIDAVYAAQKTPKRELDYLFSRPYLNFQNMIITRRDEDRVIHMEDLGGKKIAVVQGAALQEDIARLYPEIKQYPVSDELGGLLRLSSGEVDAMIIEPSRASYIIQEKQLTNLRIAGPSGLYFHLGYMVRRDLPMLRDIMDIGLASIPAAEHQMILNKWVTLPVTTDYRPLWWAIGIIISVGGAVAFWNFTLRRQVRIKADEIRRELYRRQAAEKELSLTEEQFRHIIEFCPLGIHMWRLEADGRLILTGANTAAEHILRADHRKLLGQDIGQAFPSLVGTDIPTTYARICSNGIPWNTTQFAYKDNQISGVYEIYAFQTAPGQCAVMFSDVSQRIAEQNALRQSEAQLASIFRATSAGMGLAVNRTFVRVNDQFCQMSGYTAEELIGRDVRMIYANEQEYIRAGQELYANIETGKQVAMQVALLHKDGRHIDVILTAAAVDINDPSKGITFALVDITELVSAQKKLAESETRLASIFRSAPAGMGLVLNRVFMQVNDYTCKMTGYSREELLGQNSRMLYPSQEEYDRVGSEKYAQIRQAGVGSLLTQWRRKDGVIVDILLSSASLKGTDVSLGSAFTAIDISELIAARKKHEEDERLLDGIFQTAPVGLFLLDREKRYLKINRHLARLGGQPVEKHIGRTVAEMVPAVAHYIDELYPTVFDKGDAVFNHLVVFQKPDQVEETIHCMLNVFPFHDLGGKVVGMLGSVMNITDIKRAEQALVESERRLSTLMGNLSGIAYRAKNEPEWPMEFISKACLEMTGYPDTAFMNRSPSWDAITHPEDRQKVWDAVQAALHLHQPYTFEYRIRTADKQEKWFWEQGCGIFDSAGQVTALEGLIIDITDRKRIEQQLEFFKMAVERSGDIVFWISPQTNIIYANETAVKTLGYTRDELVRMRVPDIAADFSMERWEQLLRDTRQQKTVRFEPSYKTKSGRVFPVEVAVSMIQYEGGQFTCALVRDISERRKYQDALDVFIRTVSSKTGQAVLDDFVLRLSQILGAEFVILGKLTGPDMVEGLSICANGDMVEPYTYQLEGTPCEVALKQGLCSYPDKLNELFPKDTMIRTFGIRAYVGISIYDLQQRPIGVLCALFRNPLTETTFHESIIRVFANQAATELQRMESQRSLRLFQFAVEHSGEMAYWIAPDARFVYVNQAACRELGYTQDELLTMRVWDIDPEFAEDKWFDYWQDLREKKTNRLETVQKTKDGRQVPMEVSANLVDFDGLEYNCAFVRNISERRRYQNAIDAFIRIVSTRSGQDIFRVFAEQLTVQLGADMALIGRLTGSTGETVRTLAVFKDGRPMENFTYSLIGTPCEKAIWDRKEVCIYDHVADQFPDDVFLREHGLQGYIGIPLWDVADEPIGILCVLFRTLPEDIEYHQTILKIFANQAAIEIQRQEAEHELADSEMRFREMFARMSSAVVVYEAVDDGREFILTDMNPAAERIEKVRKQDVLGKTVTEVFPGISEFGLLALFRDVYKSGHPAYHPITFYTDKRATGWRENYVYKLPTGEVVALYDDVTEKKLNEEALRTNAERIQALLRLNQMIDASLKDITDYALEEAVHLTCSKVGYLAFVNEEQTVLTMHSWSREAMAECRVDNKPIVYPLEKTGLWGEAVRQRKPIVTNDYAAANPLKKGLPQGHIELIRHLNVPIIMGNKVVIVVGVGNKSDDYTQNDIEQLTLLMEGMWRMVERINARQAREKLLREVQAKNEELESIMFVASHDMRSPLVNIQGFAGELYKTCRELTVLLGRETLSDKNSRTIRRLLDEDIPESIGFISAGTTKMDILVKGLLQIARIGTMQMHMESINMDRMMASVLKTVQFQMREYGIEIHVEPLPPCYGDWVQLNQVFSNLIDNAIKYRHPARKEMITIKGSVTGNRATYAFSDNGIGIEQEHCEKIFEIFHRLDPSGPVKGEGLGLTIVRRILDRLEGKIHVEAQPGVGSTFFVTLPVSAQPEQ